jgi:hypothetical protein
LISRPSNLARALEIEDWDVGLTGIVVGGGEDIVGAMGCVGLHPLANTTAQTKINKTSLFKPCISSSLYLADQFKANGLANIQIHWSVVVRCIVYPIRKRFIP